MIIHCKYNYKMDHVVVSGKKRTFLYLILYQASAGVINFVT